MGPTCQIFLYPTDSLSRAPSPLHAPLPSSRTPSPSLAGGGGLRGAAPGSDPRASMAGSGWPARGGGVHGRRGLRAHPWPARRARRRRAGRGEGPRGSSGFQRLGSAAAEALARGVVPRRPCSDAAGCARPPLRLPPSLPLGRRAWHLLPVAVSERAMWRHGCHGLEPPPVSLYLSLHGGAGSDTPWRGGRIRPLSPRPAPPPPSTAMAELVTAAMAELGSA